MFPHTLPSGLQDTEPRTPPGPGALGRPSEDLGTRRPGDPQGPGAPWGRPMVAIEIMRLPSKKTDL